MTENIELFSAYEIRDEIGSFADGDRINEKYLPIINAALAGPCLTSDKGPQIFVVNIDCANQHNIDTAELIWPVDPLGSLNQEVPLQAIIKKEMWLEAKNFWEKEDPISWTAFVWRVAVPIANRLNILSSWSQIQ